MAFPQVLLIMDVSGWHSSILMAMSINWQWCVQLECLFRKGKESSCCPPFWLFSPSPFSSPYLPPVSCISPSDPWLVIVTHCRALVKYLTRLVVPSLGDGIVHCPGNGVTCRLPQERFGTFYIFPPQQKRRANNPKYRGHEGYLHTCISPGQQCGRECSRGRKWCSRTER